MKQNLAFPRTAFRSSFALLIGTLVLAVGPSVSSAAESGRAQVYPAVAGEPVSTLFQVEVNQINSPVYLAKVQAFVGYQTGQPETGTASFTSFDISGATQVTVTYAQPVQAAKIVPASSRISASISGRQVTFTVSNPGQLTLEINGDVMNSLHLFANPFETDAPNPKDPNVIYFGPGIHNLSETLKVTSGKTVYVAEGAILYGQPGPKRGPIISLSGSDITLRGRGIVDGGLITKENSQGRSNCIIAQGSNIRIEGLTVRDCASWNLHLEQTLGARVSNIKVFGWRENSDGTDIDGSTDVVVDSSFYRTYDDLVVIKAKTPGGPASADIAVRNCVLWNEKAHALTIGSEILADVQNIQFTDNDVIHDTGHDWLLRINNADSGTVRGVTFQNIRIEEARGLILLWIGFSSQSKNRDTPGDRGGIENVSFRNISSVTPTSIPPPKRTDVRGQVPGPAAPAELEGFDSEHAIRGVQFQNVTLAGRALTGGDIQQNGFVRDVTLAP